MDLANKYRPHKLSELIGQSSVVMTLSNAIEFNQLHHAYLFWGIRGSGKTSASRILAAMINCINGPTVDPCGVCDQCKGIFSSRHNDVEEMDAASGGKIDEVREIKKNAYYAPISGARKKIYIIDECLPSDSKILMADGKIKRIGELVEKNIINFSENIVKSYDIKNKCLIDQKIKRYIKIPNDKQMYEIEIEDDLGRITTIKITGNHKVFANEKYTKTSDLSIGDEVIFYENKCKFCSKLCRKFAKFCSKECSMKYRHGHKEEYAEYFQKLRTGNAKTRKYPIECKTCGKEKHRRSHEFCSMKCFHEYRKQHKEEYDSKLPKRPKLHISCLNCGKIKPVDNSTAKFCEYKCYLQYKMNHKEEYKEAYSKMAQKGRENFIKFKNNNKEKYDEWRRKNSERMKINNPSQNPEILARIKASNKKFWDTHPEEKEARIKRFMQAPLRGRGKVWTPTSLERKIMDLNIYGLKYVGDGSVFVTIGCSRKRKKNPDFLLTGKKKVVEVGDINFWHTLEEIAQTIKDYECIGYKCLYLTNVDLENINYYSNIVKSFCA